MKKANKLLAIFLIAVLLVCFVYFIENQILKSLNHTIQSTQYDISNKLKDIDSINGQIDTTKINIGNKQSEINSANDQLNLKEYQLASNASELQQLKSGDKNHLHDPIFSEVKDFIKNDDSNSELELIENAKNQGIRCAYVQFHTSSISMYTAVGFNTLDEGWIYYQSGSDYQYNPNFNSIEDTLVFW